MKKGTIIALLSAVMLSLYPMANYAASKDKKTEQTSKKSATKKKDAKIGKDAPATDSVKVEKPQVDRPGLFHVKKEKGEWFFEIPDSLIGRELLATVRFTSTPADCGKFGGEMVNQQTVYFQVSPDERLLLRSKLFVNVSDTTQLINRAITISNEHPIIGAFKVDSHKNGLYRINVNGFFRDDNPALGIPEYAKNDFGLRGIIMDMSYIEDIKSFPMNTEIRTVKTFAANPAANKTMAGSRTGKVTLGLNVSFVLLPSEPMQRRIFDPRVGYFTEQFNSYNDDQQRVEGLRFAARYRLEARPEDRERQRRGEAVEPIKPIVYYIDPATPKQWRKYLIQGVEDWQIAFEQAGWKNAIQAREWPEEDSTMSMEDARYCCIRYLASPIANAYGPHVSDPRTGEILESHICWYHNVMTLVHDWYMVQASSIDEAARKMRYDEELLGELIRFVSSHEVGHSLGLRHNFGASSCVPVDSLRSKTYTEANGHTPSIMDYARFNYVAQPGDGITRKGTFPRIGEYDKWAIQWGYAPSWADDEHADQQQMAALTTRMVAKGRQYVWGDGEARKGVSDPRYQTEDLGDDAMKASTYGVLNLQREVKELFAWTQDDEHDYYGNNLNTMYSQMRTQFMRYMGHVARNIGGYLLTERMRGEAGDAATPQPKDKQKRALQWLNEQVLKEPIWLREVSYARRLTNNPQNLTLSIASMASAQLISRLGELNELYPADEYLTDVMKMVYAEADSKAKVSTYRSELQRSMTTNLINTLGNEQNRPAVLYALQQLQRKAKTASATAADAATRAHWSDIYDKIGRALEW